MDNEISTTNNNQVNALSVINTAIEKGQDPEKLEKLFDLYERDQKRIAEKQFIDALASFQSELGPIIKKKQVDFENKSGGRTNFDFANIDDIAQSIRPILSKYNLSYRFEEKYENNFISVSCVVSHEGGHSIKNNLCGPADSSGGKNPIQSIASTTTYLRRYTLTGALGITTGNNDNDGGSPEIVVDDLLAYNSVVREQFYSLADLKEALREDDYARAREAWAEVDREHQSVIWRAPSKGGILTTEERAKMKSNEWGDALK